MNHFHMRSRSAAALAVMVSLPMILLPAAASSADAKEGTNVLRLLGSVSCPKPGATDRLDRNVASKLRFQTALGEGVDATITGKTYQADFYNIPLDPNSGPDGKKGVQATAFLYCDGYTGPNSTPGRDDGPDAAQDLWLYLPPHPGGIWTHTENFNCLIPCVVYP